MDDQKMMILINLNNWVSGKLAVNINSGKVVGY